MVELIRREIDLRLHRVKISDQVKNAECPRATNCLKVENSPRCNLYFEKCQRFNLKMM
jgi:hypothetical protein